MKPTLTVITPAGTFTRATATRYPHIVVWDSPRAKAEAGDNGSGVKLRWAKDHGYGVTWHTNEAAANRATKAGYQWDRKSATLVGIFPVDSPVQHWEVDSNDPDARKADTAIIERKNKGVAI